MVLLHGFAGDPLAWREVIEELEGTRAVALPGHGGPAVQPTWEENLDAIASLLDDDRVLVGYSLGARVALGLLARGVIRRAILVGVNPGLPEAERAPRRATDARWAQLLRDRGIVAFVDAWEAQPLFATQARVEPARLAERRARRLALDPEALARSLETMGLAEMPAYRIDERCHVIVGADDAKFIAIAEALGVPYERIAGAGHDVPLEQPAALARAIRSAEQRA